MTGAKLPECPTERPARRATSPTSYLSGKPITYYRPRGSADVRHLIDHGFQAFNAGRLSEACHIFTDKMLAPENDTTIGLTIAGALTPAGLGGCVIELMERGLVDFVISTGANLYHDLHYALNFTLHRGSPFLDDVELYEQGIIRIYDVLFPATVLLETDAYIRDFLVRSKLDGPIATSEFHYRLGLDLLERNPGCEEYSVVAAAALAGVPIYTSSPGDSSIGMNIAYHELMNGSTLMIDPEQGRQRGLRDHPRRQAERLRDPRRRIAEELLPAGSADAVGGLRHPEGRQRLLHPDHDRSGGLGRPVRRDAGRSGQLGQGEPRRAARHRRRLLRLDDRLSAVLRVRGRLAERPPRPRKELVHQRDALVADLLRQAKAAAKRSRQSVRRGAGRERRSARLGLSRWARCPPSSAPHAARCVRRPRIYADANVPAGVVAFMRTSLGGTCCSCSSTTICGGRRDMRALPAGAAARPHAVTLDRDYFDDRRFPRPKARA